MLKAAGCRLQAPARRFVAESSRNVSCSNLKEHSGGGRSRPRSSKLNTAARFVQQQFSKIVLLIENSTSSTPELPPRVAIVATTTRTGYKQRRQQVTGSSSRETRHSSQTRRGERSWRRQTTEDRWNQKGGGITPRFFQGGKGKYSRHPASHHLQCPRPMTTPETPRN